MTPDGNGIAVEHLIANVRGRRLPPPSVRRMLRLQLGLTQREVAGALGVDRVSVARYESGVRTPRGATRDAYMELLNRLAEEAR
jgi:transcriptional regulator with XRE-family HTH domain